MNYVIYVSCVLGMAFALVKLYKGWTRVDQVYAALDYRRTELVLVTLQTLTCLSAYLVWLAPIPVWWGTKLGIWAGAEVIRIAGLIILHHMFRPAGMCFMESLCRAFGYTIRGTWDGFKVAL